MRHRATDSANCSIGADLIETSLNRIFRRQVELPQVPTVGLGASDGRKVFGSGHLRRTASVPQSCFSGEQGQKAGSQMERRQFLGRGGAGREWLGTMQADVQFLG
jgi:hypothetical protein